MNFCGNCGAKVIRNRLTPKILAEQVNRDILAIDNRLFRTFYALLRAPQDVIVGYINGVRRKYQDVLQYFAVALTIAGFQIFLMKHFFPEVFNFDMSMLDAGTRESMEKNPFLNMQPDDMNNFQALTYIISLPLSAISSYLAYVIVNDDRFNLTEHFVINLYYSAQVIIFTALASLILLTFNMNYLVIVLLLTIPNYLYYFFVLQRVFDDSFLVSLGKYLIVMTFQGIVFIMLSILIVIIGALYAILTM
jgi:hypothetical protein